MHLVILKLTLFLSAKSTFSLHEGRLSFVSLEVDGVEAGDDDEVVPVAVDPTLEAASC